MRYLTAVALVAVLALGLAITQGRQQAPEADPAPTLDDLNSKASYSFGLNVGRQLASQNEQLQLDLSLVLRGISDALTDAEPLLGDEEIQQTLEEFNQVLLARQMEMQQEQAAEQKEAAAANAQAGAEFRAEFAKKEGVQKTDSGVLYQVLEAGDGTSPGPTDTVSTYYKGTLVDGTVFDQTEEGEPLSLQVDRFIDGWSEILQKMKVGGKWRVVIPPELGYGEGGTPGGPIGPNATLVFEVELLEIK